MGGKRKADDSAGPSGKKSKGDAPLVNPKRWRTVKEAEEGDGPVLYWMSRDQRMDDNWALLHAAERAAADGRRVAVCFNLVTAFLGAGARQFCFMLRGLKEMAPRLEAANIRFYLLEGAPGDTVPKLVEEIGAGLLVMDQCPLRLPLEWREKVKAAVSVPVHEVDAHNVVPVWVTSDKREYAARTIRPKVHKHLGTFLEDYPELPKAPAWDGKAPEIEWERLLTTVTERGEAVPEVKASFPAGEAAARAALDGDSGFLSAKRLKLYSDKRNDPNIPQALSNLSPYFHFGQLSAQRAAIEAIKHKKKYKESVESFLEESVVRRELSDNFCFYEKEYDSIECASDWAKDSLAKHASDKREHLYSREELEESKTHDDLWNAAQKEMVHLGKMHGFLRMYWAKKILEWTESPEVALETAMYLNDKYEIDGRDPNGYVGCMWSICGIHDQGWAERDVFGKIRYMNYNGCKRKFNIPDYISSLSSRISAEKKARKSK